MVGGMTVGALQAFVSYVTFMMWPMQDLARVYSEMQHAVASAERTFSLVDAQPEVADLPGARDTATIRGRDRVRSRDFYYEPDKPVLTDFSLRCSRARRSRSSVRPAAASPPSSTWSAGSTSRRPGSIKIHGQDYRDFTLHSIHSRIGVVLQTPHLFSGTSARTSATGG
jgi:ATP-binding cassette, subfamily B, bacterial